MRLEVLFAQIKHTWYWLDLTFLLVFAKVCCVVYHCLKLKRLQTQVSVILVNQEHFYQHATVTFCCSEWFSSQARIRKARVQVHLKVLDVRVLLCRSTCWHIALAALFTHDRISSQVAEWMNWSVRRVRERLNLDHKWKV